MTPDRELLLKQPDAAAANPVDAWKIRNELGSILFSLDQSEIENGKLRERVSKLSEHQQTPRFFLGVLASASLVALITVVANTEPGATKSFIADFAVAFLLVALLVATVVCTGTGLSKWDAPK